MTPDPQSPGQQPQKNPSEVRAAGQDQQKPGFGQQPRKDDDERKNANPGRQQNDRNEENDSRNR